MDSAPCQKWAKRVGFVAVSKMMAGVGPLKRICKDAIGVAGAVQEIHEPDMLRSQGADCLTSCILEYQIFKFAKMILPGKRSTF